MKIYINRSPKHGPWGGGTKTVNKLWEVLLRSGHEVVNRLEPNIDIIFCFDPRPNEFGDWYQSFVNYRHVNPTTKIVQRVGDLGTHSKPNLTKMVKETLEHSDYFIFPSQWSKEWVNFESDNCAVINNAPMSMFYENRNINKSLTESIRVVTHHWSTNPKKGFHIYQQFEEWCENKNISFHYIGQLPQNVKFKNHTKPMSAKDLSAKLPEYDIYLTASEEEAGANHVLEAMAAGLPIVYKETGGSICDYCSTFGEKYLDFNGMIEKIEEVVSNYSHYKEQVLQYTDTNDLVVSKYCEIIEKL